jgi:hypothetical protein
MLIAKVPTYLRDIMPSKRVRLCILGKTFFFILNSFFLIWVFASKNLKNGPSKA